MNRFPIATDELVAEFVAVTPATDMSDRQTADRDGVPQWRIQCLLSFAGEKRALGEIKIAASTAPSAQPMAEVRFVNLRAFHWQNGDRGGIALSADDMKPASSSTNGTRAKAPAEAAA